MRIRIWGVRGSVAAGTARTSRFGGNTTCVEARLQDERHYVFDAGTGIYALGRRLADFQPGSCTLCFTHVHWDHICGLPHFEQLYDPRWALSMMGVRREGQEPLRDRLMALFDGTHFPVESSLLRKDIGFRDVEPGFSFTDEGGARLSTCETCHPGGGTAWRIDAEGWSFVFTGDHEWDRDPAIDARLMEFCKGADVLLADSQYLVEELESHRGWGHSCMESWVVPAAEAGVRTLLFTHHDPGRDDRALSAALSDLRRRYAHLPIDMQLACEGMGISVNEEGVHISENYALMDCPLCDFSSRISTQSDPHAILESILTEARRMGRADAGTFYLVEDGQLVFSHSQNDTLFSGSAAVKQNYIAARMPISNRSIVGSVVLSGKTLNIADVRRLPEGVPYGFNESFDNATGYRTVSMLTVPVKDRTGKPLGVLQIINCMLEGKPAPFSALMQTNIERLAALGASCIERGLMMRETILRMLRISALNDPMETGSHVLRVGAVAAEVYQVWAERRGLPMELIHSEKANIRLASMLHDVGKVGVPDSVLKKPGKLTDEEFAVIKSHCSMGAHLFENASGELDIMARDIAQHHHQKWNGTGYTGDPAVPVLAGEEIPIAARITAVADVYDALVSPRCYKKSWTSDEACAILTKDAGTHFDPEVVDVFLGMRDVVAAIYAKFPFETQAQEA